jgi:hypothetical protein
MRMAFEAKLGGFDADAHALICSLSGTDVDGQEHNLLMQRSPEGERPDEDWGIHLEFDDQINGDYGVVLRCRLTRDTLHVDLSRRLGSLRDVEGFDVGLGIDDASFARIQAGLQRIFHDMPGAWLIA